MLAKRPPTITPVLQPLETASNDNLSGLKPVVQESAVVPPSYQLTFVLTTDGNYRVTATPGFQGYLLIHCRFPNARAVAFFSKQGDLPDGGISIPVGVTRPADWR